MIRLACPIIKEKVPNGFLLTYSDTNDITVHVKRIHEYILQCTYVGINITIFQQWQYIIKGLPHVVRSMLETCTSNEIALAGYDRETNLPFNLRIENAASFILSEVMNKGMKKHIVPPKRSKVIDQILCEDQTLFLLSKIASRPRLSHISSCQQEIWQEKGFCEANPKADNCRHRHR